MRLPRQAGRPALLPLLLLLLAAATSAWAQTTPSTCPSGFGGNGCAVCESAAACATATGNAAATCSSSLAFAPTSQLKSYSCSFNPGLVASLVVPDSLLLQCSTGLTAGETLPTSAAAVATGRRRLLAPAAAAATGPACVISFNASSTVAVKCISSGCAFVAGLAHFNCTSTTCSCPNDATCGGNGELLWRLIAVFPAVHCLHIIFSELALNCCSRCPLLAPRSLLQPSSAGWPRASAGPPA